MVDLFVGQRGTPAGDGLEFVQGSTCVPKASAGKLRNGNAKTRNQGCKRKGDLIANTASGVLVSRHSANSSEIHAFTGVNHGLGPGDDFFPIHSTQEDGHGKRCHLFIFHDPARVGINGPLDFFGGQFPAIALHADDVDGIKLFHDVLPGCCCQAMCVAGVHVT